jgi:hypothetical protein
MKKLELTKFEKCVCLKRSHDELGVSTFTVLITRIKSEQCVLVLLTPWSRGLFFKIYPQFLSYSRTSFYRTPLIIIVFASALHWAIPLIICYQRPVLHSGLPSVYTPERRVHSCNTHVCICRGGFTPCTATLYGLSVIPIPVTCSVRLMSLTWTLELYMAKSASYEAPFYAVFTIVLLVPFDPNILLSTMFSKHHPQSMYLP